MKKKLYIAIITSTLLLLPYLMFFNHVEPYHIGISYNHFTGELTKQTAGMYITAPWASVSDIDIRPMRICVSTSGKGFNCKLVQFNPEAYREFIAVQGHQYYWLANRVSFNLGYNEEYRGMRDLMRGYAYGLEKYEFVKVIKD